MNITFKTEISIDEIDMKILCYALFCEMYSLECNERTIQEQIKINPLLRLDFLYRIKLVNYKSNNGGKTYRLVLNKNNPFIKENFLSGKQELTAKEQ